MLKTSSQRLGTVERGFDNGGALFLLKLWHGGSPWYKQHTHWKVSGQAEPALLLHSCLSDSAHHSCCPVGHCASRLWLLVSLGPVPCLLSPSALPF